MTEYTPQEREIIDYARKFRLMPPKEILQYMGKLKDFIYDNMTSEGRRYIEKSRLEQLAEFYK